LGPYGLPAAITLLVDVRMPNTPKRGPLPTKNGLCLGAVTEYCPVAVSTNLDHLRFPSEVIQFARANESKVLLLRQRCGTRIDELKIVGMQAPCGLDVPLLPKHYGVDRYFGTPTIVGLPGCG
jgi:hypothetical protein